MNTPSKLALPHPPPVSHRPSHLPAPLHLWQIPARARLRHRHRNLIFSFLMMVIAPLLLSGWYLYARAADQYASTLGFVVRTQKPQSGLDLLGGISGLAAFSGSSSSDTDILFEYLYSQTMVSRINARLDLTHLWAAPPRDPVFAYNSTGTIEDLTRYWRRMVKVLYDSSTGLITVRAQAFSADDAMNIARAIQDEATVMINDLSAVAHEDTMRYARQELDRTTELLASARLALTSFRSRTHIVDPQADLESEMGVLGQLQQQLAQEMIALDMLRSTLNDQPDQSSRYAKNTDVRLSQAEKRVEVIEARITAERAKFGAGSGTANQRDYSALMDQYERLTIEREFAEKAHLAALTAFELDRAQAQRQSRYLAAFTQPARAERALYPRRGTILATMGFALLLLWSILVMVKYNLRDRL